MLATPTISSSPETDPALDQRQLYALGLDHVRSLSRRLWTDHNIHDPGITILEQLCYALTDLAYRAQFPLEDLLATGKDNAANMAGQFFTARQLLPNRALTLLDYRKLLIDLEGVANAWLVPALESCFADTIHGTLLGADPGGPGIHRVDFKGLYRVLLEFDDNVDTAARRDEVKAAADALLQANRNLCECFVGVDAVQDEYFSLCAELELEHDADPAQVAARVQFDVEGYLSPPVPSHSLSDMLARGLTVAQIFEGPQLTHGFIDDAELAAAELRTELRLSDIIGIIMDIPGVRAVRDILVNPLAPDGKADDEPVAPPNKWRLPVRAGRRPRLSGVRGRLVFYKLNMPVRADRARTQSLLDKLRKEQRASQDVPIEEDLPIPLGRFRRVAAYRSFQHHFPVLYGLSQQGLQPDASPERKALALQLKGYLLFFDQVMANYLAQLASVRQLFSRDPHAGQTYFAQAVDSFPDSTRVYAEAVDDKKLAALLEDGPMALARRNRFLDHLLARFAEDFHHYVSLMDSAFGAGPYAAIATKCDFLRDYPQLGAERSLAYDYTLKGAGDLWNSRNVSGLERRIARLLGIGDYSRRDLADVDYSADTEIVSNTASEFVFRVLDGPGGPPLFSASAGQPTQELAREAMLLAIERGQTLDAYRREVASDGSYSFDLVDSDSKVIAHGSQSYESASLLDTAIENLVIHLRSRYSGEGMYLIENILLRPGQVTGPFLPICVDPGCADCAGNDPYSYRLHIVLPAYAGRFRNMDFRRFAEDTIRSETPAHILPKICWIDRDGMKKLQAAYRDWIELSAGADSTERAKKLKALIDALYEVKNVYPSQKLHDCGTDDSKPPFLLGRTAIGSSTP